MAGPGEFSYVQIVSGEIFLSEGIFNNIIYFSLCLEQDRDETYTTKYILTTNTTRLAKVR